MQDAVQGYVNDPTFSCEHKESADGVEFPARDAMTGAYYIIRETYKGEDEIDFPGHFLARVQTVALQRQDYLEHPERDYLGLSVSILFDLGSLAMSMVRIDSAVWF